ncbi:2Fe-2S iron-sulfur cluster-binding protein [Haloprofundus halobius]|uniref:2Fe-2S iron-sulfur cluster-binding protein n=1 Tax=Haloprofundus halobius TaxID=2876194 RepID=UPI001CC9F763|nr:2Fe-2S iron-sulfur cluster-binding protein [Haloprofundus halobius]
MPTVRFRGRDIDCEEGAVLRDVLLAAGLSPHNGRAQQLNCRGHATCGTCAVEITASEGSSGSLSVPDGVDGDVSEMGRRERRRLSLPPHSLDSGLRLSCQTRVEGDIRVTKHDGFWGQHVASERGDERVEPE